jgi:excisionase family DNA binding protein
MDYKKIDYVALNALPIYISYDQAAAVLKISNTTVRRAVKQGKLRTIGNGNAKRISKDSLCSLATKQSKKALRLDAKLKAIEAKLVPASDPEPELTPEQQNAEYMAEQAKLPVIWVGDVGFQGVERGLSAEARATIYREQLAARNKRSIAWSQVRGV